MRGSGFVRRLARVAGAILLAAPAACSGDEVAVEERIFAGHRTLVAVTGGAPAEARLPMIVALHWSASRPDDIVGDFTGIPVAARVLLPQANYPRRDGWSWFPGEYLESEPEAARAETFRAVDEIADWIEVARREYPTDGRPIVTGISYGGDLAYLVAVRRPKSVSAAFPVAARFQPDWIPAPRPCTDPCPWIVAFHGDDDWIVGAAEAREAAARLRTAGYPVELRSYPGAGHDFSAAMRRDFEREIELRLGGKSAFARRGLAGRR
jgi:phospholipase/carboxylesterase